MENTRVELVTSCLQGRRSPNWANPPEIHIRNISLIWTFIKCHILKAVSISFLFFRMLTFVQSVEKYFFASRFSPTPMWITFVYTHACTLSSDLLPDFPCIYLIFPDFPLFFCSVIHTLFFLFSPSSQSFCQPLFFLHSLFFAESFIIKLSIQGRFFDE